MTLAELIAEWRRQNAATVEPSMWSNTDLAGWFAEAETEACIRGNLIFDDTATADLTTYSLAADFAAPLVINPIITEIERAELIDAADTRFQISPIDRIELDRIRPEWRTKREQPTRYIKDDRTLRLSAILDAPYTLRIEGYRLPTNALTWSAPNASPEIASAHHMRLLEWVTFRAYSVPDVDSMDLEKAASGSAAFEQYFGPRPDAQMRRDQLANRPHRNKGVW